ncbi:NAD(P)-dependent oxidoreductase [Sphingomonas abietis]|uniref:NAD(P)H-binding protein n=1 Tax=Sphingomonas abietis TaxID=3012344 RepID=A0ABY7NNU7_9SPHN|nr:NAD(P)H-binding protein [Sphingomonas abietis]WBO23200.1 NAD(P)H-binding protein [Sphingomonas abietis]
MTEASLKIAVIGATGRTGRLVVEQALDRGHEVVAYVRQSGTLHPSAALDIVIGELSDITRLQAALRSVDAVICCLGTYKHKPVDLLQTNLPLIVRAMKGVGLTRLILLSAYGVGETARTASAVAKILYKTMFRSIFLDKERAEIALAGAGLEWTGIYPVGLTDAPFTEVAVRPADAVTKVNGLTQESFEDSRSLPIVRVRLDAQRYLDQPFPVR